MPSSVPTPNFVLLNSWHDDNKGDSAIVDGTLTLLRERWPECRLSVIDILPDGHPMRDGAHRHLLSSFPDLGRAPSPMPMASASGSGPAALRGFRFVSRIVRAAIGLVTGRGGEQAVSMLRDADVVIANGGHYLHSHSRDLFSYFRLARLLYPVLLAKRLGKPVLFFGHSVGPFDAVGRALTRRAVAGGVFVAREELSRAAMTQVASGAAEVMLAPDAAFALRPERTARVQRLLERHQLERDRFAVITVRQWPHATAAESESTTRVFLAEMTQLVERILSEGLVRKVVLVAHVLGPSAIEDDRAPTHRLLALLDRPNVVMIDDDLTPRELSAFYGEARFLVGTRFHSVIFAMTGSTPTLAISYYGPKAYGIMEMMGMKDACVDMRGFDAAEAHRRLVQVTLATSREQVNRGVMEIRRRQVSAIDAVARLLNRTAPSAASSR